MEINLDQRVFWAIYVWLDSNVTSITNLEFKSIFSDSLEFYLIQPVSVNQFLRIE